MIRLYLEDKETQYLSSLAALAKNSMGREKDEDPDPVRTCYMRDRDRIIHSKAFRRLKHKTQVYISPNNDHYRTRLTHTLEVSQIGKTIGRALGLNEDLIEAIALAHDVGHTPFAHVGETVLNELMDEGFKHNENSVRVLTKIERHKEQRGLNLTKEVLDGVLFHSGYGKKKEVASTLEGQIIRLSDKIAYVQHDIDDSIRAGLIGENDLPKQYTEILGQSHGQRITVLVEDLIQHTTEQVRDGGTKENVVITFSPKINEALMGLRQYMFDHIYLGPLCSLERDRAAFVVEYVFTYYVKHPDHLPEFYKQITKEEGVSRGVADYISGMSDNYCVGLFKELTIPKSFINGRGYS